MTSMDSEWLKTQLRLQPDKSKADLARALKLGAPAISKILSGTRQIKAQEYIAMRRFFGMPVDGVRAASGGGERAYVLEPLAAGLQEQSTSSEDHSWVIPANVLKSKTKAPPEEIKIFAVQENAMTPDFKSGEHVIVDLSDKKPSPPGVFVVSDGMGHMIRQCQYVPQSDPPEIKFTAHNNQFESYILPLEKSDIIGRVIAKVQWL